MNGLCLVWNERERERGILSVIQQRNAKAQKESWRERENI